MGKLLNYIESRTSGNDELLVFFMPETSGPCRFGQYSVLIDDLIKRKKIPNVAQLSLTSENSYAGVGTKFLIRGWIATIIGDVLEDIGAGIKVLAKDPKQGWEIFISVRSRILNSIASDSWLKLKKILRDEARILAAIPRKKTLHDVPKVSVIGEIFTRKDELASQYINDKLAEKGILGTVAPLNEWIYYCDYLVEKKLTLLSKTENQAKLLFQKLFKKHYDKKIKKIFLSTGLFSYHEVNIEDIVEKTRHLVNPNFTGEAILTVGCAISDIIDHTDGVISIGPFGCMPSRVAEAIVTEKINDEKLSVTKDKNLVKRVMKEHPSLPFFPIESDGNVFPQVIEAKFESFCLQVERIFKSVKDGSSKDHRVHESVK
jgi:predicted nucleotide-binding protein (sugar kinase/HSP70/actin superfamily)